MNNDINTENLPFFDTTPGHGPEDNLGAGEGAPTPQNTKKKRKPKKKKTQPSKVMGVFTLPVYMATYCCLKECQFRFRKLPKAVKYIGRDIENRLTSICAEIQMVHWQVHSYEKLPDLYGHVLEVLVLIRSLRDARYINEHDFTCIRRFSGRISKEMATWNNYYNKKVAVNESAAWAVDATPSMVPEMYLEEEHHHAETEQQPSE